MSRLFTLLMASTLGISLQLTSPLTGSVSGRVLDSDTNMPIVGVKVSSIIGMRPATTIGSPATTDSNGRYSLPDRPAGKLTIIVNPGEMGPSLTPPQTVMVVDGRDTRADFHTRLFGQISGRVLDDNDNPVAGIRVTANVWKYDVYPLGGRPSGTGQLELQSVAARALTDDRGRYVIETVPAGFHYGIVANSPKLYSVSISDAPADPKARKPTLAATYYPNSDSLDTATTIFLHSQEFRDGVDIRMRKTESYCLEGTLTEGGVPAGLQFQLVEIAVSNTRLPSVNLPQHSGVSSDGKIRLCDLYPGRFQLIAARLSAAAQESLGTAEITIGDKDIRNLVVNARPRLTVSGELELDNQPIAASSQSILVRTYPSPAGSSRIPAAVPGKFSLEVVTGLRYFLDLTGMDSHSYVKDVTYGGASILHQPFLPSGGDNKLRVTIGGDAGSIAATVVGVNNQLSTGSAVVIVPITAQIEPEVAAVFNSGITNEDGTHVVNGLPPGKYDVFATNILPPSRVDRDNILLIDRTPDAIMKIMRARGRGKQIEVGPSSEVAVSLTPIQMD